MLVILAGLPGSGKTTLARALALRLGAFHLRIDTVEQALRGGQGPGFALGASGYDVAYRLAEDNLRLGATVVADSVNPLELTRQAWRQAAFAAGVRYIDVEIVCSQTAEHRRRVETRTSDLAGFRLPTWSEVVHRQYEPWTGPHLVIDTSGTAADRCVDQIVGALRDAAHALDRPRPV